MRKWLSFLLCFAMLLSMATLAAAEEIQADVHIDSKESFLTFAENCRLDSYSKNLVVSLETDIDLIGMDFQSIPIFCGTFLGNGHRVDNLTVTVKGSQRGLFRYLTADAVVRDLTVSGTVAPLGSRLEVGGIAGSNAGLIENCVFEGKVVGGDRVGGIAGINTVTGIIAGCTVKGNVSGKHFVGGVTGENMGVIRGCENMAPVNNTAQQNTIDLSDITLGTIMGTESATAVTDVGGIAGTSTGTVRDCVNRAAVGYPRMGYNVGGITGSQSGYLAKCENYGAVSGRKEVGGIVGHMEPTVSVQYETDTLQLLKAEMAVLGGLVDRAVANADQNAADIQALLAQLDNHTANAQKALEVLSIDPEDPQIKDLDTYLAALQTLSSSITGMDRTMRKLYGAIQNTTEDLEQDLRAIAEQVDVIDQLLHNAEDNLGGSVTDVSDEDSPEDLLGKAEQVVNYGSIQGDLNVGGIIGAIAIENDLDPEADVTISGQTSLNVAGKLRSVVLDAVNHGSVTAKKRNAGGIVGWQSMGLVKLCRNTAAVAGQTYTGGVAGQSLGYIRSCAVKATVTGTEHVGGIAGSGTVVTDCRTMSSLTATEFVGAILGRLEENHTQEDLPVSGNLYACVGTDWGAIDGISYDTQAQSMALTDFLAQEDLPDMFRTVNVNFVFEDGTVTTIPVAPGSDFDPERIPAVPEKAGFVGRWDGLEEEKLQNILFDVTFHTLYVSHNSVIQSGQSQNGKPLLLIQGDFLPDATVTVGTPAVLPPLSEGRSQVAAWQFAVEGGIHTTAVRCLFPANEEPSRLLAFIRTNGSWKQVDFRTEGSYLIVGVECDADAVALVREKPVEIPWMLIAVLSGAAVTIIVISICVAAHKKKKRIQQMAQAAEE